jgi:hypothetical protein
VLGGARRTVLVAGRALGVVMQGRREPAYWTSMWATEDAAAQPSARCRRHSHCFVRPSLSGLATYGFGVNAWEAAHADAMPAPAGDEADVGFRAQRTTDHDGGPRTVVVARLALGCEYGRGVADPDNLRLRPLFLPSLPTPGYAAARSANFANRLRNVSFTVSVGPLRCFARCTSARPCWSDSMS